jgi:AcrR family transcriptional regulator
MLAKRPDTARSGKRETAQPPAAAPAGAGARRRERHRQETRDEILRTARQILIEEGAERLTMREIARRTEFTPSALYRYFENGRQEILLEITRGSLEVLDAHLARLRTPPAPAERIVAMGASYLRFAHEHPQEERLLFDSVTAMEALDLERPDESILASTGVFRLLESAFREGMADGSFRIAEKDLMFVIMGTWVFVHGLLAVEGLHEQHGGTPGDRACGLIRAYVNGLGSDWAGRRSQDRRPGRTH